MPFIIPKTADEQLCYNKNMAFFLKTKKPDSIRRFLRQELGNLEKDFTHIEPVGDVYLAVLKTGHRVVVINYSVGVDLTRIGANMEIWRAQTPARAKWVVPVV
ncbi:MAG: hypothetical protein Q8L21_01300, partial [Candidatus Komeilibacteria bacterium]|nr:hypothetical protein [Candidatus Komeilibacteria bacterium]